MKHAETSAPHMGSAVSDITALDRSFFASGVKLLAGVDEAGRGPLAGPVCAAAVIFPPNTFVEGVNDSKKLTPHRREQLYEQIKGVALTWAVGWADPGEIDTHNILQATKLAMLRALATLQPRPDLVVIDCVKLEAWHYPQQSFVKGDARSHAIAAASILAKVERDRLMTRYEEEFPGYGFAQHKGYPTRQHFEAIERMGLTTIHRRSFVGEDFFRTRVRHSQSFMRLLDLLAAEPLSWHSADVQAKLAILPEVERSELAQVAGISPGNR
jgi:ribonuclease HII